MNKNLKIACYGFVDKKLGSVSGANFLVIEELLKRGYQIDFFNRKGFVYPQELFEYDNFQYFNVKHHRILVLLRTLPCIKKFTPVLNLIFNYSNMDLIRQEISLNHQFKKYDLLLFLGCYSKFKIEDIPSVTWVQGPPHTERYFNLQKLWKQILSIDGISLYLQLLFFYAFKAIFAMPKIKNHNIVICGSQWSKQQLISYGFQANLIKTLPYPMDTNLFQINTSYTNKKTNNTKTFLWLGRSDPRKRLDLLLEAYALLLKERQDVNLKIFGKFRYAKGYKKLIDNFEHLDHIEYQVYIHRLKVPELMTQCDILIQPSEGENFGSSVAEALCCGLPVIVGPTNGTKDYISSSSFVFKEYTPESLKETMLQSVEAVEQNREKLAVDARETAEKNFSVSRIVDNLEDIFHEALRLPQPTSSKS